MSTVQSWSVARRPGVSDRIHYQHSSEWYLLRRTGPAGGNGPVRHRTFRPRASASRGTCTAVRLAGAPDARTHRRNRHCSIHDEPAQYRSRSLTLGSTSGQLFVGLTVVVIGCRRGARAVSGGQGRRAVVFGDGPVTPSIPDQSSVFQSGWDHTDADARDVRPLVNLRPYEQPRSRATRHPPRYPASALSLWAARKRSTVCGPPHVRGSGTGGSIVWPARIAGRGVCRASATSPISFHTKF